MRFFAFRTPLPVLASICIYLGFQCPWYFCFAFSLCYTSSHSNGRLFNDSQQRIALYAKLPPTSNFDLASIEAFETALNLEEDIDLINNDSSDISIADRKHVDTYDDDDDNIKTLSVPDKLNGKRIDAVLAKLMDPPISRSACGNLITDKCVHQIVTMKGIHQYTELLHRKSFKVNAGMTLRVVLPKKEIPTEIIAQNIPLEILYEDEHMIVINKKAGMVVHPAVGNWDGTVVNALAYYLANSLHGTGDFVDDDGSVDMFSRNDDPGATDDKTISLRPGIVHRLDKGTTGILVVSKTTEALSNLSSAFAARKVKKTYLAITVGNPGKRVVIDKPIGRHPIHRQRMRVVPDPHRKNSSGMTPRDGLRLKTQSLPLLANTAQSGRRALSYVDTLEFDGKLSLVKVRIETGRTHQIRVHLQDRHTPIYGDDVYGIADWNKRLSKAHGIQRPLLHAHRLEIKHPITGKHMIFVAPMPTDMVTISKLVWPESPNKFPEAYESLI